MIADIIRQQANVMLQLADLCDNGAPLKDMLERLDRLYPRKESLGAVEMAAYWGVSENTARERMHAADFPSEKMGYPEKAGRLVVSKLALALYEIGRASHVKSA